MESRTPTSIQKSAINTSPSKQMFSFGSQSRFPKLAKPNCEQVSYDLPQGMKKRAAGFGFGRKNSTFLNESKSISVLLK